MKERLVTFVAALGALALFAGAFLQPGGRGAGADVPRPTTSERRADGYSAARSWLEGEGVRVISLRERLGVLAERRDLAPVGNLLIITLPGVTGFSSAELASLEHFIRAGNALLVVAALADVPHWAVARAGLTPGDVNLLTGLSFEPLRLGRRGIASPAVLVANGEHPYLRNVRQAVAVSDPSSDRAPAPWVLKVPYAGFALVLAHERASGAGVLWTRPLGAGRIIVSGFGSLFTNRALGLADNGQLLANIVAANVGPSGSVMFDDLRQGLGAVYDPAKFYHDPRLAKTVAVLIALWLAWVLGSTRLRAPQERSPVPRESELLHATGALLARVVPPEEAARRLFDHLLRSVGAARGGVSCGPSAADRLSALERHPRLSTADLERLKRWHADALAGRRVPLRRLHELIGRTEKISRP
ncbi:MAG TPA: DUF4350 domain-containing protein [Steroidobacteraceae bacterium]|nr:DUF4350 domain-containing protein [Steroidobacteraceae bacterium]